MAPTGVAASRGASDDGELHEPFHLFWYPYICSRRWVGISRSRVLCLSQIMWSSERKHVGDAWAHEGDEGRGKLR
jgi:hypothetical protein